MAGSTKLGTYQYEVTIDGKKAVLEIQNIEQKTVAAGKKIEKVGAGIGQQFQNWIKSGLGFNALLGGATEAMMKLKRAIAEGIDRAAANNEKARKSFESFGKGIENLFTKIGSFMLPLLTAVTNAANKALNAIGISTTAGATTSWGQKLQALDLRRARGEISQEQFETQAASRENFNLAEIRARINEARRELDANQSVGNTRAAEARSKEILELEAILTRLKDINKVVLDRNNIEENRAKKFGSVFGETQFKDQEARNARAGTFTQGALRAREGIFFDMKNAGAELEGATEEITKELNKLPKALEAVSEGLDGMINSVNKAIETYKETGDAQQALIDGILAGAKQIPGGFGAIVASGEALVQLIQQLTSGIGSGTAAKDEETQRVENYIATLSNKITASEAQMKLARQQNRGYDALVAQGQMLEAQKSLVDYYSFYNPRVQKFGTGSAEYANALKQYNELLAGDIGFQANRYLTEFGVKKRQGNISDVDYGNAIGYLSQYLSDVQLYTPGDYENIASIQQQILDIEEERAKFNDSIADSMKAQADALQKQISTLVDSGLIDVENIAAQSKINMLFDQANVSGLARMEAITSLGLQGQNIGTINIEVNEATGNTVEAALQARMIALFGGN